MNKILKQVKDERKWNVHKPITYYSVKRDIPDVNISAGDVGLCISKKEKDILLYNKKWDGHSGNMGDLSDKHYWWFKKDDLLLCES